MLSYEENCEMMDECFFFGGGKCWGENVRGKMSWGEMSGENVGGNCRGVGGDR